MAERRRSAANSATAPMISDVQVSSPAGKSVANSAPNVAASRTRAGNRSSSPVTSSTD